ncbi:hypothetical protein GCM10022393_34330 [Aquimarina addita]|uniref:Uncharacterized protein n=2 Tax=Aquimarina addita TaxID=870485 RepID=A0ABP6URF9_9FLAO
MAMVQREIAIGNAKIRKAMFFVLEDLVEMPVINNTKPTMREAIKMIMTIAAIIKINIFSNILFF